MNKERNSYSDGWKNLERDNLPPDILTGKYDFEVLLDPFSKECKWGGTSLNRVELIKTVSRGRKYRYRPVEPELKVTTIRLESTCFVKREQRTTIFVNDVKADIIYHGYILTNRLTDPVDAVLSMHCRGVFK